MPELWISKLIEEILNYSEKYAKGYSTLELINSNRIKRQ